MGAGGLPWEQQPARPAPPPTQREYPSHPQAMRPDVPPPRPQVPVVARNQETGESVKVDIGQQLQDAIKEALSTAVVQSKDHLQANAQRALVKGVQGKKPTIERPPSPHGLLAGAAQDIEGAWESGPATTRTFMSGMAIDVGFAMVAILATVLRPGVDLFDKELWSVTGILMIKTMLSTGISYVMKVKVQ